MARSREQVGGETIETWWSYLVLAICFVLNSVVDGIGFSVGPLVVSWLHAFDKDQQVTGWISSIYMAIMFSTGKNKQTSTKHLYNIYTMLDQRPTLYKC